MDKKGKAKKPIIKTPGRYVSRRGHSIEIFKASQFECFGYCVMPTPTGFQRVWRTWAPDGTIRGHRLSQWDVIRKA